MSSPLQGGAPEQPPVRKSAGMPTDEKISAILDLLGIIARALLRIFGKRKTDQ